MYDLERPFQRRPFNDTQPFNYNLKINYLPSQSPDEPKNIFFLSRKENWIIEMTRASECLSIHSRLRLKQCDQMGRSFDQELAIVNNNLT